MHWDAASNKTIRKIGNRNPVESDGQLIETIDQIKKDYEKAGKIEVPVVVDATADVPWQDVVHVVDLCKPRSCLPSASPSPCSTWANNRKIEERAMKLIENAPWWLVSAGIHAVLILGAALIYVERLMAIEEPPTQVILPPTAPPEPPIVPDSPREPSPAKGFPPTITSAPRTTSR